MIPPPYPTWLECELWLGTYKDVSMPGQLFLFDAEHNPPRPATKPRRTAEGQLMYDARMAKNMRQSDLASLLSIHSGRISEWEQGTRPIPANMRERIFAILGLSTTTLN